MTQVTWQTERGRFWAASSEKSSAEEEDEDLLLRQHPRRPGWRTRVPQARAQAAELRERADRAREQRRAERHRWLTRSYITGEPTWVRILQNCHGWKQKSVYFHFGSAPPVVSPSCSSLSPPAGSTADWFSSYSSFLSPSFINFLFSLLGLPEKFIRYYSHWDSSSL